MWTIKLCSSTFLVAAAVLLTGCAGTAYVDMSKLPETYQCEHMKEVCKDARDFERTYEALPVEEKNDAENILKAYRSQCNDALEFCKKSASVK